MLRYRTASPPAGIRSLPPAPLLLVQLGILCLFTGCLSTRRAGRIINERLQERPTPAAEVKKDYLDVRSSELVWLDTLARTRTMRSWCVPAIFYWGWGKTISCDLNPSVPTDILTAGILQLADSVDLRTRLDGARLELTIEHMPSRFIYHSEMTTVYLVLAYVTTASETLRPDGEDLVVTWTTYRDTGMVKTGTITITEQDPGAGNVFRSTRHFLRAYVDQYKDHVHRMGGQMMEQLLMEL
jgi:hypothetical protein